MVLESSFLKPYQYQAFSKSSFSVEARENLSCAYEIEDLFKEVD